jgi:hypothetical protein
VKTNCGRKRTKSSSASTTEKRKSAISTRAKSDCAEVRKISSRWRVSRCMAPRSPAESAKAAGRAPIRSVHWFTFEEIIVPMPAAAAPRSAKRSATMNSGDSEASGASHCTSRNSSTPYSRPVATRPSAKGSAAVKMVTPAKAKIVSTATRRQRVPYAASI